MASIATSRSHKPETFVDPALMYRGTTAAIQGRSLPSQVPAGRPVEAATSPAPPLRNPVVQKSAAPRRCQFYRVKVRERWEAGMDKEKES